MARSSAGRSVLHRAVAVLDAFDEGTQDLSVSEVTARTGMPLSTCHRLLSELVEVGLLERQQDKRYRVGLRLWELAVRTPGALGIFFFQAEDGIRDGRVTGVQTCALPIYTQVLRVGYGETCPRHPRGPGGVEFGGGIGRAAALRAGRTGPGRSPCGGCESAGEIGRASCRERV